MSTIIEKDAEKWGRMGVKANPFGVPIATLKEQATIAQIEKAIPMIYVQVYAYTHNHKNSSKDAYYSNDYLEFHKALFNLAEVLKVKLPTVEGYSALFDRNPMRIDGEAIKFKKLDWSEMKQWIIGFATALRTIPFPNPAPNFDNEKVIKAFRDTLETLDLLYISVSWE